MGAGGSIDRQRTKSKRVYNPPTDGVSPSAVIRPRWQFSVTDYAHSPLPANGVGRVIEPPCILQSLPPPPVSPGEFAWFVENLDRPGDWDIYPPDICARLDAALSAGNAECQIVSKKRMCTVNLRRMEESAASGMRVRRVRRAAVESSVSPDGTVTVRERRYVAVDPFVEEDEADPEETALADAESLAAPTATTTTTTKEEEEESKIFPKLVRGIGVHSHATITLAHAPNGETLLTGTVRQLFHWDVRTAANITAFDVSDAVVLGAVYAPSGGRVLCGASDSAVRLFDTMESIPRQLFLGHVHKVYGVDFFPGESRIATASMDSTVRYWDVETCRSLNLEQSLTKSVFALATSKKCDWLAITGGTDNFICAHDFRIGKNTITAHFIGHTRTVWSCNWRHDELQFVSGGMDKSLHVWDLRCPAEPLLVIRHHTLSVHHAEFMPNGKGILSSARDKTVRLTNATTGEAVWRATAQLGEVFRARYNAYSGIMATCGVDRQINIWEYSNPDNW